MRRRKLLAGLALCLLFASTSFATGRKMVLHVNPVALAWSSSRIDEAIVSRFTREREFQLTVNSATVESARNFPGATYDIDSLLNWGAEFGGRYLLSVDVSSERLDKKRTMHIPLILHRYETVGIIDAEIRLLDLERGRMILAEPLAIEVTAKRIIQADPDKDQDDADIHIRASDKAEFFMKLERKFADELYKKIYRALRNK